jgi:hypothetical protein
MAARCLLTIVLFLLGVPNLSQARIGDTLQQAIERYGKVVNKAPGNEFVMFKEASYYITAHLHDDKTDAITYVKTRSQSSAKSAFSDEEIEMLLRINGNGQSWERSRTKAGVYEWKTEDRKLQAVCSESKFLVITTAGYLKRLEEAAKKKKTSKEESKQKAPSGGQKSGTTRKRRLNPTPRKSFSAFRQEGRLIVICGHRPTSYQCSVQSAPRAIASC